MICYFSCIYDIRILMHACQIVLNNGSIFVNRFTKIYNLSVERVILTQHMSKEIIVFLAFSDFWEMSTPISCGFTIPSPKLWRSSDGKEAKLLHFGNKAKFKANCSLYGWKDHDSFDESNFGRNLLLPQLPPPWQTKKKKQERRKIEERKKECNYTHLEFATS